MSLNADGSYSSDEDRFGFTYKELNDLIRNGVKGEHYEKIMGMYNRGKFKIENIRLPYYDPGLPINPEFVL